MDRMPGEEQSRSEGGQRGKPTHEDDSQQHRCEAVPQGVHDVKPSGAAIRDGPIHGIAQNRKWSIQAAPEPRGQYGSSNAASAAGIEWAAGFDTMMARSSCTNP